MCSTRAVEMAHSMSVVAYSFAASPEVLTITFTKVTNSLHKTKMTFPLTVNIHNQPLRLQESYFLMFT